MKNLCLFIWVVIGLLQPFAFGQSPHSPLSKKLSEYKIHNWTTEDGLASNTLLKLFQDKAGYLWISSYDGLTRFDGSEFITYTKSNGLPSSQVQSMIGDNTGCLWIGTGAGLVQYGAGKFTSVKNGCDLFIQTLWCDQQQNSLLIGTRGQGLFTYDFKTNQCKKIESAYDKDIIRAVLKDNQGRIWAGSEKEGLSYYLNGQWKKFNENDGLLNQEINSLYLNSEGSLYVGTNGGLFIYDGSRFTVLPRFADKIINSLAIDNAGNLWVLTSSGLYRQNTDGTIESLNPATVYRTTRFRIFCLTLKAASGSLRIVAAFNNFVKGNSYPIPLPMVWQAMRSARSNNFRMTSLFLAQWMEN